MSDVKWCDVGQHPFTTAIEGWVHSQAAMKTKTGGTKVADYDICPDHQGNVFGTAFDDEQDDLDRRLAALEAQKQEQDRRDLARFREIEARRADTHETSDTDEDEDEDEAEDEFDLDRVTGIYPEGTTAKPTDTTPGADRKGW